MGGENNQVVWRGVQPVEGISGIWPSRNAVRVNERGLQSGSGNTIVYTVPANKKLYIGNHALHSRLAADASAYARLFVRDDADDFEYMIAYQLFDKAGQLECHQHYHVALEAEAGWDVVVGTESADIDAYGFIFGFLEDA